MIEEQGMNGPEGRGGEGRYFTELRQTPGWLSCCTRPGYSARVYRSFVGEPVALSSSTRARPWHIISSYVNRYI